MAITSLLPRDQAAEAAARRHVVRRAALAAVADVLLESVQIGFEGLQLLQLAVNLGLFTCNCLDQLLAELDAVVRERLLDERLDRRQPQSKQLQPPYKP